MGNMEVLDKFIDGELTVDQVMELTGLTPTELDDLYNQQKQDEEFERMAEERIQYQDASKF